MTKAEEEQSFCALLGPQFLDEALEIGALQRGQSTVSNLLLKFSGTVVECLAKNDIANGIPLGLSQQGLLRTFSDGDGRSRGHIGHVPLENDAAEALLVFDFKLPVLGIHPMSSRQTVGDNPSIFAKRLDLLFIGPHPKTDKDNC